MAANPEMTAERPEALALDIAAQMAGLVERGAWSDVENLAVRLRAAVMNVPEAERRQVILDVQRVTNKASAEAEHAQRDVTEKLSALRRGQAATEAYQSR